MKLRRRISMHFGWAAILKLALMILSGKAVALGERGEHAEIPMQAFQIDHEHPADSLVDASFLLDAPAGRDGFVKSKNGHLVKADGSRLRIWGVNMTGWTEGSTNLPPKSEAAKWADIMARAGINCARFHFLDMFTEDDPSTDTTRRRRHTTRGMIAPGDTTQNFDPEALDRLDFFTAELKKRGIYINLNLNVGRRYRKGDDVPDYKIIQQAATKGMTYIGPRLLELQRDYAKKLLTHYNPYTKSKYANEPAVVCVEILNENSVLEFWERNWLRGELHEERPTTQLDFTPLYEKQLTQMYQDWLAKNRSASELAALRKLAGVAGGAPVPRIRRDAFRERPAPLFYAEAEFYQSVERDFFLGMKEFLQKDCGVESLILATADHTYFIPNQPLIETTSKLDIVDGHVYWQHPGLWGRRNTPMVDDPLDSTIVKLSRSPVAGMPFTVSEVNHPNPNEYDAEMIPILAAYGAFQDWDGIYFYTFETKSLPGWENFPADHFDITLDPVKMTQMPVGAMIFSRADVAPANKTVERSYSEKQVYESSRLSEAERPYFTPGFPLSIPLRHGSRIAGFDGPPTGNFDAEVNPPYITDTGELRWDVSKDNGGIVKIETPRTAALVGFVRDSGQSVRHILPEIKNDFCAITLSSLTPEPIWKSKRLLLTACSRWQNTGSEWNARRTMWGDGPGSEGWGTAPTLIEPVTGWVTLRDLEGTVKIEATPLDGAGRPIGKPLRGKMVEKGYEIPLGDPATNWYLIEIVK